MGVSPEVTLAVARALFSILANPTDGPPQSYSPDGPATIPPLDPPATCCGSVCANVPAGKRHLVVCDGTTMKALVGTADGQYPAWDAASGTWVLANV